YLGTDPPVRLDGNVNTMTLAQRAAPSLSAEQQSGWQRDGFFRIEGFADKGTCAAMLERVVEIARAAAAGDDVHPALILPEANLKGREAAPEGLVSKIFKLHRDT